MAKQYGLIVSNKDKVLRRPAIFGDDSDSDEGPQKPTGLKNILKKQDKINQQKVLEEDPTVYQYDEVYDEMDQKRKESKLSRKDLDRKPKYISRLLAAADRRKKDNERRIERQIQKERETEGDEFKDKESFITTAYKKKLEEMKEIEELEKREEYLESIGDVTKQVNLDGFYRHLYDQKVNHSETDKEAKSDSTDKEKSKPEKIYRSRNNSDDSEGENDKETVDDVGTSKRAERKYRSRKSSDKSEEDENEVIEDIKKEHLPSNLDADSDFSIDSSDSEDEKEKEQDKKDLNNLTQEKKVEEKSTVKEEVIEKKEDENEDLEEPQPKKPNFDIWKKRTVGEVFDAALKRYFERKAVATY